MNRAGYTFLSNTNITASKVAQKSFGPLMNALDNSVTNLDAHDHHMTHIHNVKSNLKKFNALNITN